MLQLQPGPVALLTFSPSGKLSLTVTSDVGGVAPGSSYPAIVVTVSIATGGTVTNTASVTGGGDAAFHSASDTVSISSAVLAITKTHTGNFTVGQSGSYTITVSNTGKLATGGVVTIQDFLPSGLSATAVSGTGWNCGTLPTTTLVCTRSDALNPGNSYPAAVSLSDSKYRGGDMGQVAGGVVRRIEFAAAVDGRQVENGSSPACNAHGHS